MGRLHSLRRFWEGSVFCPCIAPETGAPRTPLLVPNKGQALLYHWLEKVHRGTNSGTTSRTGLWQPFHLQISAFQSFLTVTAI